jgi:hypothetical protein
VRGLAVNGQRCNILEELLSGLLRKYSIVNSEENCDD